MSLAISYRHLGDTLWESGASDAALDAYRKSLAIDEALVASDPGNAVWQRDLAIDYLKIGNVLLAKERYDDAREILLKKLAIDERLAAAAPNDLDAQSALAASYAKLTDVMGSIGRLDEALEYARKALAITQRLRLGRSHQYAMAAKSRLRPLPRGQPASAIGQARRGACQFPGRRRGRREARGVGCRQPRLAA